METGKKVICLWISQLFGKCRSKVWIHFVAARLADASDGLEPGLVEGGAHVHPGQEGRGALDAVGHRAGQNPPAAAFHHQWTAAVTLFARF
jgi:hypothetical protein